MLMEVDRCVKCGKLFTFFTSKCSQIILKQGHVDASIIFLPKCPDCSSTNRVEVPWDSYGLIDY
jgi:phage FluMu protein Com